MQKRVTRGRLAGEPADVVIAPRLGYMRALDYHHAGEAIAEGREMTRVMVPFIRHLLHDDRAAEQSRQET